MWLHKGIPSGYITWPALFTVPGWSCGVASPWWQSLGVFRLVIPTCLSSGRYCFWFWEHFENRKPGDDYCWSWNLKDSTTTTGITSAHLHIKKKGSPIAANPPPSYEDHDWSAGLCLSEDVGFGGPSGTLDALFFPVDPISNWPHPQMF